jgi:hypothetical protein
MCHAEAKPPLRFAHGQRPFYALHYAPGLARHTQALVVIEHMELKSENEELWLLRHPGWVRWLGWIGMPVIFVSCCYVLLLPVIKNNYEIALIVSSLFLGGFPIWMCIQGFKVFPYLQSDVEFNLSGFSVYWPNGKRKEYLWSNVSRLTHYASVQVLEIKSNDGERILTVTEQATSYAKFVEIAVAKTGLKY